MVVLKSLYGIAEAGTHWWVTYNRYHKEKLGMVSLTYDSYLLITDSGPLGIVSIQTDDIVILRDEKFSSRETNAITFKSKKKTRLNKRMTLTFNECTIVRNDDTIIVQSKEQGKKILLINIRGDVK